MIKNKSSDGTPTKLFVMAGMPRAGTTYIFEALRAHPGICLPFRKELSYFSSKYTKGDAWYWGHFARARPGQVCADISPDYFIHKKAVARIATFTPRPKVVLAVRDPASWAVSYHRHLETFEWKTRDFGQFLELQPIPDNRFFHNGTNGANGSFSIRGGVVRESIESFRAALGSDLLLYSFELFKRQPLAVMQAIERFLEVTPVLTAAMLPQGLINASGRRNLKPLSYLVSREEFVQASGAIVPKQLLANARSLFDRLSARGRAERVDPNYERDFRHASTLLSSDIAYCDALFSAAPMQLGDGRPFP